MRCCIPPQPRLRTASCKQDSKVKVFPEGRMSRLMHGSGDCRRQVGLIEGFGELG
jgi:hypothetical protein